jgi:hypothetical protein
VEVDVERRRELDRAWREVRVGELRRWLASAHELKHRARLQALADGWGVDPEQRPMAIPARGAPSAIPVANATAGAERPEDLRIARWRDCGRTPSYLRKRAIAELHWQSHGDVKAISARRWLWSLSQYRFDRIAESREGERPSTRRSPTKNVGVDFTPALRARSRSAAIKFIVECLLMQSRQAGMATPARVAMASNVGTASGSSPHFSARRTSVVHGQNFP